MFQKLDKSKLPNLANAWPAIATHLAAYDPGNQYAVNYMWGTVGIGYNVKKARERLGEAKIDSWDTVFHPAELARFKDCGVHMLDSSDDILPAALHFIGRNPNSTDQGDLEKAADLVAKVRPSVRKFHSSEYLNALASGEICLVVGWSGDIKQAHDRAREAGKGDIAYSIPREGAMSNYDVLAIPADAPHVRNAHLFINYLLRADVAARNSELIKYANALSPDIQPLERAVRDDPGVYPPPEVRARLVPERPRPADYQRLLTRMWTRFKTGK